MIERGSSIPVVMKIIMINVVIFGIQEFTQNRYSGYFAIIPELIAKKGMVWQVFTYMFLHGDYKHILFNMYAVFIFGITLEQVWGPKLFLKYYFFCGVGAGLSIFVINYLTGNVYVPTIGASGAVFGLLVAFGLLFPESEILLFFILPIKAKYFVLLYGMLELYLELSGSQDGISHIGHLGGIVFGLIFFVVFLKIRPVRTVKFKNKLQKEKNKSGKENISLDSDRKREILEKLQQDSNIHHLSDDEFQYIKYLDIMVDQDEDKKDEPKRSDISDLTDNDFIIEVRKYIEID